MVGLIDDAADARDLFRDQRLNALLQRHFRHATALAPPAEGDIGDVVFDVDERDVSPMVGDGGVDMLVNRGYAPLLSAS
jgi:hypothetical protein